jgi:hypothetical protein
MKCKKARSGSNLFIVAGFGLFWSVALFAGCSTEATVTAGDCAELGAGSESAIGADDEILDRGTAGWRQGEHAIIVEDDDLARRLLERQRGWRQGEHGIIVEDDDLARRILESSAGAPRGEREPQPD